MSRRCRLHLTIALGACLVMACAVEVTTIGSISSSSVDGLDAGLEAGDDVRPDDVDSSLEVGDDVGAPGTWTTITMPVDCLHFRAGWVPFVDQPWILGIHRSSIPVPDGGPIDSGFTPDGGSSSDGGGPTFSGALLRRKGSTWVTLDLPDVVDALWGADASQVWAVGTDALVRTDGTTLTRYVPPVPSIELTAVWGASANDVWAGGTKMLHWDGSVWKKVALGSAAPDRVRGIWGASASDVWAVSEAGIVHHWNGIAWSIDRNDPSRPLRGVWGSGANDVWVVGLGGTLLHWNGVGWSMLPSGTLKNLFAVSGSSKDDVWFVGEAGTILRWSSSTVTQYPSAATSDLTSVSATDPTSAWAVGDDVVLRFQK